MKSRNLIAMFLMSLVFCVSLSSKPSFAAKKELDFCLIALKQMAPKVDSAVFSTLAKAEPREKINLVFERKNGSLLLFRGTPKQLLRLISKKLPKVKSIRLESYRASDSSTEYSAEVTLANSGTNSLAFIEERKISDSALEIVSDTLGTTCRSGDGGPDSTLDGEGHSRSCFWGY